MKLDRSVQSYWDNVADTYDQVFPETLIGRLQRAAVWRELIRVFRPGQRILELNCGTGIDAVYLASKGVSVLACDVSPRMIEVARNRSVSADASARIDFRVLPTEEIASLSRDAVFDGVFSNFSGLNCVSDHSAVARNLAELLRPGAHALFCVMGGFVPMEIVWFLLRGQRHRVTGKWRAIGRDSAVEIQVPSVRVIARTFEPQFRLERWRGISVMVPPSSLDSIAKKFPRTIKFLTGLDKWVGCVPGLRNLGDCALLEFRRV